MIDVSSSSSNQTGVETTTQVKQERRIQLLYPTVGLIIGAVLSAAVTVGAGAFANHESSQADSKIFIREQRIKAYGDYSTALRDAEFAAQDGVDLLKQARRGVKFNQLAPGLGDQVIREVAEARRELRVTKGVADLVSAKAFWPQIVVPFTPANSVLSDLRKNLDAYRSEGERIDQKNLQARSDQLAVLQKDGSRIRTQFVEQAAGQIPW